MAKSGSRVRKKVSPTAPISDASPKKSEACPRKKENKGRAKPRVLAPEEGPAFIEMLKVAHRSPTRLTKLAKQKNPDVLKAVHLRFAEFRKLYRSEYSFAELIGFKEEKESDFEEFLTERPEYLEYLEYYKVDTSDSRFAGWESPWPSVFPVRRGSTVTLKSTKLRHLKQDIFEWRESLVAEYVVTGVDRKEEVKEVTFSREGGVPGYCLRGLRQHLESLVGEDVVVHQARLRPDWWPPAYGKFGKYDIPEDAEPAIGEIVQVLNSLGGRPLYDERELDETREKSDNLIGAPHLIRAFNLLAYHAGMVDDLQAVVAPLGSIGAELIAILNDQFERIFHLGCLVTAGEYSVEYLSDVQRGEAVVKGSRIGAELQGQKESEHADAWKRALGRWVEATLFQMPEIKAKNKTGISYDDLADYIRAYWPRDGFKGTLKQRDQKAPPSTPTLRATLKMLEREGIVKSRKSPPKGRRPARS